MKKKEKKKREKKEKLKKSSKDISDLIDELAYVNESIQKSKRFLDNMYILAQE